MQYWRGSPACLPENQYPSGLRPFSRGLLGAHAIGLPHLKFLLEQMTHSVLLGRERIVPSREYRLTSGCAAWSHYRLFSALRLPTVAYPACSPSLAPHRPPSGSRSDEKSGLIIRTTSWICLKASSSVLP